MKTSVECLAKATDMDQRALACLEPDTRATFEYLAAHWRDLSFQAAYQHAFDSRAKAAEQPLQ